VISTVCLAAVLAQMVGSSDSAREAVDSAIALVLAPSYGQTFGSGFFFEHDHGTYLVTCRHVIEEAGTGNLLAIPRPKKTKALSQSDVLKLGRPMYHPDDSATGTYDVCVLQIVAATIPQLRCLGIRPLRLQDGSGDRIKEGFAVETAGYPTEYAERELALDSPLRLEPLHLRGTVNTIALDELTQWGFGSRLREGHFVQTEEMPLGKGASGGPVYIDGGCQGSTRVIGVLVGSGELQHGHIRGFVFADSDRIIQTRKEPAA